MNVTDTHSAVDYFKAKMEFTTGPVELKHKLDSDENINIIDVRYPADYAIGHIPTSHNLPKDQWTRLEGLSREKMNIIYCYSGVCHLAAAAALYFAEQGFPVMELEGGFAEWKNHEFPIES
jgi:rhodanese-related sulfurtransferase